MKELFLGAFFTACVSSFLDYCFIPEEIFGRYRLWLHRIFINKWRPLVKPLGECSICMNGWLSVISFFFTGLSILWLIPYISVSYVFLQVISRIEQ